MMRKLIVAIGITAAASWLSIVAHRSADTDTAAFDELRAGTLGSESTLLSRDGEPLQRLRVDMTRRQLEWTSLDSISPSLVRAVVAAEDHRFWWHFGFDPASGLSALMDQFGNGRGRGASTITMQLAGLMIESDRFGRRSFDEKLAQFRYATCARASLVKAADHRGVFESRAVARRAGGHPRSVAWSCLVTRPTRWMKPKAR